MMRALAPELSVVNRTALANEWLAAPMLRARMEGDPAAQALLGTTVAPTMITGGVRPNVLPAEATAMINFRIHPRDNSADLLRRARQAVADLDGVTRRMGRAAARSEPGFALDIVELRTGRRALARSRARRAGGAGACGGRHGFAALCRGRRERLSLPAHRADGGGSRTAARRQRAPVRGEFRAHDPVLSRAHGSRSDAMMRMFVLALTLAACAPRRSKEEPVPATLQEVAAPTPQDVAVRINAAQNGQTVEVAVNQRFAIELVGVPTAGYVWAPAQVPAFITRAGEVGGNTTQAQSQPGFTGGNHWEVHDVLPPPAPAAARSSWSSAARGKPTNRPRTRSASRSWRGERKRAERGSPKAPSLYRGCADDASGCARQPVARTLGRDWLVGRHRILAGLDERCNVACGRDGARSHFAGCFGGGLPWVSLPGHSILWTTYLYAAKGRSSSYVADIANRRARAPRQGELSRFSVTEGRALMLAEFAPTPPSRAAARDTSP